MTPATHSATPPLSRRLTPRSDTIRVVLADDHAVVRAGLRALLTSAPDIEIVGEAANGREALAMVEKTSPHVLILDLDMPVMDGASALRALVTVGSPSRCLILTMHDEQEYLVSLLEAGAGGYLAKSAADRELSDAIRAVAAGDTYVQPSAARALAREVGQRSTRLDERRRYDTLSDRERDVLVLVAGGLTASQIGERLLISPKTVETYKQRVAEKLSLAHRSEYVQLCLRLGLLHAPA